MENTFKHELRRLRKQSGYKLLDVVARTGIDQALLSKFENGSRLPTDAQIKMLAECYLLDFSQLKVLALAEKIYKILEDEDLASQAMALAEPRIQYLSQAAAVHQIALSTSTLQLLREVDRLHKSWSTLSIPSGTQKQKMDEYFSVQYTYESNRIEGNTLSLGETMMVIKEGITISGKTVHEHLEAINHHEAIEMLYEWVKGYLPFNERLLLQIHGLILRGIDRANAGIYRKVDVRITGSEHLPPQPYMVPKLMEDYFLFYQKNAASLHPVILAAEMHERLVSIHPFIDGNGRTARLVMNLILLSHGYPLVILKGDHTSRQRYYQALEQVQVHGDAAPFHDLVVSSLLFSIQEHITLSKPGV
ncbi:MAG: Fic family protein [Saprospiraceae bacterium]|nr:Fic family protein [Saprospiraceae bacterium]MBK8849865.1 Fic family protein [Saprospiraceae bacterium]